MQQYAQEDEPYRKQDQAYRQDGQRYVSNVVIRSRKIIMNGWNARESSKDEQEQPDSAEEGQWLEGPEQIEDPPQYKKAIGDRP